MIKNRVTNAARAVDNDAVPAGLDALHVLADYWEPDRAERTMVGDLVHSAKDHQDEAAARRLAALVADLARYRFEISGRPVLVGAVPARPVPSVHLPTMLGRAVAAAGVGEWAPDLITRSRASARLRDVEPVERPALARAAGYRCEPVGADTLVVIVDDVVLTGTTLGHVARCVRAAGAAAVAGLAAARSVRVDT